MNLERDLYPGMKDYLKEIKCVWRKRHGCQYARDDSDFLVLWNGVHYEIEVKRPGEKATDKQWIRLEKCVLQGGVGAVVKSLEQFKAALAAGQGYVKPIEVLTYPDPVQPAPKRLSAAEKGIVAKAARERQDALLHSMFGE